MNARILMAGLAAMLLLLPACGNGDSRGDERAGTLVVLGDGRTLAVDGETGAVTPVNGPLKDVRYIPSPDGRSLLIACGDDATAYIGADDTGLCMYGSDGYVQLTDSGDLERPSFTETDWGSLEVSWRLDSGAVAFLARERAAESVYSSGDIYVLELSSGDVRRIAEGAFAKSYGRMKWSPDGKRIAVAHMSTIGQGVEMDVIDAATGAALDVGEDLPGEGLIEQYAWSPDSASLAFTYNTAYNGGGVNLYVAPADGSDLRKLTTIWPATEPAWSPDGEWIAASDVIGNFASAYIVRSDGSERREIGEGLHDSGQPAWSPDGRSVAFPGSVTDEFGQQRLFEYDLERGERRIVAPDVTLAFFPIITFSRDGERIFFTADAPPCMEGCPPGRLFMIERKSDSLPTRLSDDLVSELLRWQP